MNTNPRQMRESIQAVANSMSTGKADSVPSDCRLSAQKSESRDPKQARMSSSCRQTCSEFHVWSGKMKMSDRRERVSIAARGLRQPPPRIVRPHLRPNCDPALATRIRRPAARSSHPIILNRRARVVFSSAFRSFFVNACGHARSSRAPASGMSASMY